MKQLARMGKQEMGKQKQTKTRKQKYTAGAVSARGEKDISIFYFLFTLFFFQPPVSK